MANRLLHESSLYLRQHAENPVDWYPWGKEAFCRAREENKPIHLSIGYAACHWCHVMAHESFESQEIAQVMNERFINIKVDRQERPDLDDIYQKVVQMQGQGGGWPLTVFLTPQAKPFFGGTYFPPNDQYGRPGFLRLLLALSEAWQSHRLELEKNAQQFLNGYQFMENQLIQSKLLTKYENIPDKAAHFFVEQSDPVYGGLGRAPKFPNFTCYDLILRIYQRTKQPPLLKSVELMLDHIAAGGIYDQLGGGFARYSIDERWLVPHFEKMLYDNGQLIKLYADAYRLTGNSSWRRIFEGTITYVLRDMKHVEGAFYASEDADSEGKEGKFYVWSPAEVQQLLGRADGDFICGAFGITEQGNFEDGTTVLHRAIKLNSVDEERLLHLSKKLLIARSKRTRPKRDENILTSWNALMIQGLCAAYQATGTICFLDAAKQASHFIQTHLALPNGEVYRVWKNGTAKIQGFLDDYAFLANAYIDLYESCFEKKYLDNAAQLTEIILKKFWEQGLYFTASDSEQLIHRPRAATDSACPSATSASIFAFLRLYALIGCDRYQEHAAYILQMYEAAAAKDPFSFAHFLAAQDFAQQKPFEIIIAGDKCKATSFVESIHRNYFPLHVLAFADDVPINKEKYPINNQPTAYVCRNKICQIPVDNSKSLLKQCGL